jgi:hypothetical protein
MQAPSATSASAARQVICPSHAHVRVVSRISCTHAHDVQGRGGNSPPCKPDCLDGETIVSSRTCELGGTEAFCCTTNLDAQDDCAFYGCTSPSNAASTCPSSSTLWTTVVKYVVHALCQGSPTDHLLVAAP